MNTLKTEMKINSEKFKMLIETLLSLRADAIMALDGDWDRTDSGFEAQIDLIDKTLKELE